MKTKNVALFGGTFDPVHLGHVELVKAALAAVPFEKVILIPCWQSPFKGKAIATSEQRCEMLRLTIAECGLQDHSQVSEFEINRPEPSYTWQTALHFRESEKEGSPVNWHWILGADQWIQIHQWARPEQLRLHLSFLIMTRAGVTVRSRPGWKSRTVEFHHEASSTRIREEFSRFKHWLPTEVARYCEQNGLYQPCSK